MKSTRKPRARQPKYYKDSEQFRQLMDHLDEGIAVVTKELHGDERRIHEAALKYSNTCSTHEALLESKAKLTLSGEIYL